VVAHVLAWLDKYPNGPFFMWVHLYDAHDPYDPPEPTRPGMLPRPMTGRLRTRMRQSGNCFGSSNCAACTTIW